MAPLTLNVKHDQGIVEFKASETSALYNQCTETAISQLKLMSDTAAQSVLSDQLALARNSLQALTNASAGGSGLKVQASIAQAIDALGLDYLNVLRASSAIPESVFSCPKKLTAKCKPVSLKQEVLNYEKNLRSLLRNSLNISAIKEKLAKDNHDKAGVKEVLVLRTHTLKAQGSVREIIKILHRKAQQTQICQ